jgi:(p)ppGpp synthase/HD superfamily hydrolase
MKDNFEFALQFALDKHKGQLDKGWTPYIMHLLGVWSKVREASLKTQIVALLHDSLEDTATTYAELEAHFGKGVADTVDLLTHAENVPYESYVQSIAHSGDRSALLVKIADLADNSSPERLQRLPDDKREYYQQRTKDKYLPARKRLIDALKKVDAKA